MSPPAFQVEHSGKQYDIAKFLEHHPGGINYVSTYKDKDVAGRMEDTGHSNAALYLMREYKVGGRDGDVDDNANEDLEKLVDWSKPLLHQVGDLGKRYSDWVYSPVDREIRLFHNSVLEGMTYTPWYSVPLVWIPIIIWYLMTGWSTYTETIKDTSPYLPVALYIISGMVSWTILEYALHRYVFHLTPGSSRILITFHFVMHGLHHKAPFDTRRLVFPPIPGMIIKYILVMAIGGLLPERGFDLIIAGNLMAYLCYDMIHYYLHAGSPEEGTKLYYLKRYHNHHHFSNHNSGFGISNVVWDKIFGTAIKMRKLKMGIKWH